MSRPNPLLPVIVNVKTLGVNTPVDYTRVFGLVSYGDTNITAGEIKTVSRADIDKLELEDESYTKKFLNAFFSNNAMGVINVFESKAKPEPAKPKSYVVGDYYVKTGQAYKCIKADTAKSAVDAEPKNLLQSEYWETTSTPKTYKIGEIYTQNSKTYKCLKQDNATSATNLAPTNLSNGEYWKDVTETDEDKAVKLFAEYVMKEEVRCYEWALPTAFYKSDNLIELVKGYAGITAGQYFSIELPKDTDPATDETFAKYLKSKSFVPVYPSPNDNEAVNGAIVGIKAGLMYTLNISNPLSPLQWKKVVGITPNDTLDNERIMALNENGCTWVGSFNRNIVVLGGMVGDGKSWDFYFALDTYIFRLIVDIGSMMISGSNNPLTAVRFNQNGIDMVRNKLISISNAMVNFYVLSEFGSGYDTATNGILDRGQWAAVDYPTYKANQYEDWKNGVYNGASCYATIGSFMLQIVPNITVE